MQPPMSDSARAEVLNRLACVRGHLNATRQMVERGDHDLAVAHQLHAVRRAVVQIQVQLLRTQLARWADDPIDPGAIECDLAEIMKSRKR